MKHHFTIGCICNRCKRETRRRATQADNAPRSLFGGRGISQWSREETHRQEMHKWAVAYDKLNGAPENDGDR